MDLEQLAEELIKAVGGIPVDTAIENTVDVFKGIMTGMNNNWEQHLAAETNALLMQDDVCCSRCGQIVRIERRRDLVSYSDV